MSFELLAWLTIAIWIGFRTVLVFARPTVALGCGLAVAIASLAIPVVAPLMVSILAPFGILLPALAVRDVCGRTWMKVAHFHWLEITLALIASTLFVAASIGVFSVDPYRLGYQTLVPGVVALIGIVWAVWRQHHFVLFALLLSQAAWTFGFLSSNFFDLSFHAMIVPVCVVTLVKRAFVSMKARNVHHNPAQ